jgi:hypothetical protein
MAVNDAAPNGHLPAGAPHLTHDTADHSGLASLDRQAQQLTQQTGTPHHVVQNPATDSFYVKPKG